MGEAGSISAGRAARERVLLKRYHEHGDPGLCDRPRRPLRSPKATLPEVVSKILYLRQNYHFGPGKIADYLRRFH